MKQPPSESDKSSPGVITTLAAGFELTTNNAWLVILPILVDIFYWLGPRLTIARLVERNMDVYRGQPGLGEFVDQLISAASQINLLTSLSIPIIGLPALMSGPMPEKVPIDPTRISITSTSGWLLIFLGLSGLGLILASLYLKLISLAVRVSDSKPGLQVRIFFAQWLRSVVRLAGLGLVFIFITIVVSIPLIPIALIASFVAGDLFLIVLMIGFLFALLYLSLSLPAIVFAGSSLGRAIVDSIRLVHVNRRSTLSLILLIFLIGRGMNLLWHIADDGSWLTLVSIGGHSFISTALMASLIIFYRDRSNQFDSTGDEKIFASISK